MTPLKEFRSFILDGSVMFKKRLDTHGSVHDKDPRTVFRAFVDYTPDTAFSAPALNMVLCIAAFLSTLLLALPPACMYIASVRVCCAALQSDCCTCQDNHRLLMYQSIE